MMGMTDLPSHFAMPCCIPGGKDLHDVKMRHMAETLYFLSASSPHLITEGVTGFLGSLKISLCEERRLKDAQDLKCEDRRLQKLPRFED